MEDNNGVKAITLPDEVNEKEEHIPRRSGSKFSIQKVLPVANLSPTVVCEVPGAVGDPPPAHSETPLYSPLRRRATPSPQELRGHLPDGSKAEDGSPNDSTTQNGVDHPLLSLDRRMEEVPFACDTPPSQRKTDQSTLANLNTPSVVDSTTPNMTGIDQLNVNSGDDGRASPSSVRSLSPSLDCADKRKAFAGSRHDRPPASKPLQPEANSVNLSEQQPAKAAKATSVGSSTDEGDVFIDDTVKTACEVSFVVDSADDRGTTKGAKTLDGDMNSSCPSLGYKISDDGADEDETEATRPFIAIRNKTFTVPEKPHRRFTPAEDRIGFKQVLTPYNIADEDEEEKPGRCLNMWNKLRADDNATKILTVVLFLLICCSVGTVWVFYQKIEYEIEIGREIHFWENTRHLNMIDIFKGQAVLVGALGVNIPEEIEALPCGVNAMYEQDHHHNKFFRRHLDHLCLKWPGYGVLQMDYARHSDNITSCYHVFWSEIEDEMIDCYKMDGSHWYGGPQTPGRLWPIDFNADMERKAHVSGDLYKDGIGSVIESYWLNSNGVAIRVNRSVPLYSSVKKKGKNRSLCLSTGRGKPPFNLVTEEETTLEYTVCNSIDIIEMHYHMTRMQKSSMNRDDIQDSLLMYPSCSAWETYKTNPSQEQVLKFVAELNNWGINCSRLTLHGDWETKPGEMTFDEATFDNIANISAHLMNCSILLSLPIHPFVDVSSTDLFQEAVKNQYFIKTATDETPALLEFKTGSGLRALGAVLNLMDDGPRQWFLNRILELKKRYNIPSVHLAMGHVTWLPAFGRMNDSIINPSEFTNRYAQLATVLGIGTTTLTSAFYNNDLNTIIYITDRNLTWEGNATGLGSVIPTVLDLSLKGYRYPALRVGSQLDLPEKGERPSKELYIRSLQLAAFLPAFELTVMPWTYDDEVLSIAKAFIDIHRDYVTPIVSSLAADWNDTILRPLWDVDPNDENLFVISDQFMIGNNVVVAPVVQQGHVNRDIYLPRGRWLDKNLGVEVTGKRWLRKYAVPLRHTAYFERIEMLGEHVYAYH